MPLPDGSMEANIAVTGDSAAGRVPQPIITVSREYVLVIEEPRDDIPRTVFRSYLRRVYGA